MLISITAEAAEQNQTSADVDGQPYLANEYIGSVPKPGSEGYGRLDIGEAFPQAYLVIQPPHSVTRPHFHQTNQFQVFVGGSGKVGKLRADPVTVQYAGGHTPYGPIVAGDEGISYFTLRQRWDSGAKYMPAMRDSLMRGRQRQRVGSMALDNGEAMAGASEPVLQETIIEPEADGLLAQWFRLAPGATTSTPNAAEGGGQYHVVVNGSLWRGEKKLAPLSVEFVSPEEGPQLLQAGATGLDALLLRFPR